MWNFWSDPSCRDRKGYRKRCFLVSLSRGTLHFTPPRCDGRRWTGVYDKGIHPTPLPHPGYEEVGNGTQRGPPWDPLPPGSVLWNRPQPSSPSPGFSYLVRSFFFSPPLPSRLLSRTLEEGGQEGRGGDCGIGRRNIFLRCLGELDVSGLPIRPSHLETFRGIGVIFGPFTFDLSLFYKTFLTN